MRQTPGNRVFYRAKHVVPSGAEHLGHFLPRQPLGPAGQKPAVAGGQTALAVAQGTCSTFTPQSGNRPVAWHTGRTRHAPQRHELESAVRQAVVARPRLAAAGADRPAVGSRPDLDFDGQLVLLFEHSGFSVHEGLVMLDPIEDSLELHPVAAPERWVLANPSIPEGATGCTSFSLGSALLYCVRLVKRSRALLGSNPTRDSQVRAGE